MNSKIDPDTTVENASIYNSHTELDSHTNMVIIGSNWFVFYSIHEKIYEVEPFDTYIGTTKEFPIVDTAIG